MEERVFNSLGGHCHRLHHKLQTLRRCFGQPLETLFGLYSCAQRPAKDGFIKAAFLTFATLINVDFIPLMPFPRI